MAANKGEEAGSELENTPPEDGLSEFRAKDSVQYANRYINEHLHPALADFGITYDSKRDCFSAETEETYDEAALFDNQRAFVDALEGFQRGTDATYKSQIDLKKTQTWDDVLEQANKTRIEYMGVGKKGIMKRIDKGLRTFQTAAPAIEAWLRLLPSTTIYGSIICGGLTIILEVGFGGQNSDGGR